MRLDRWFDYESGHAWCESAYKYQTVSIVAEFANTITNLPLIMLPLVNVLLIRPYIETVNWIVILPHMLLTINGIASTYYHATLNLFDCSGRVRCGIAVMTAIVSTFCFVKPSMNALVLMLWSIPGIVIIHHEAAKNSVLPRTVPFAEQSSGLQRFHHVFINRHLQA
uniref:Alkaline ceramidase n=1 Tax=Setaria digitata TaxID=48799 RepID=A0A915PT87_9BILA